jgi:hypothetical protein
MHASVRPSAAVADDRSSKGVLWRAPSPFQNRMRDTARKRDLTQNAYLTTGALFNELLLAHTPEGAPEHVVRLVDAMNRVVTEGGDDMIVMDACREADWKPLSAFLAIMRDANVVGGIREQRSPALNPDALLYAFTFSKEGAEVWKLVGPVLLTVLTCTERHGSRPSGKAAPKTR